MVRGGVLRRTGDATRAAPEGDPAVWSRPAPIGPPAVTIAPMAAVELERVEILELLAMTLAHLNIAEERRELSARVPLLMGIRDKLVVSLREDE